MNEAQQNTFAKNPTESGNDRVSWLRGQTAELKKRWPPHSVPVGLLLRLEELEDELETELRKNSQPRG